MPDSDGDAYGDRNSREAEEVPYPNPAPMEGLL